MNFFAVFKIDKEHVKMQTVVRSCLFYEIRREPYKLDNEKE